MESAMNNDSLYRGITLLKNNIAPRSNRVKDIAIDIVRFLTGLAVVAFAIYLKYRAAEKRVKDLGDGGIQTLFENQKHK
jgi:hypothetical protein